MKKKLLELSVEEFTRVLLDFEETHHVEMKSIDPETGELRKDEIVGTYEQIEDACFGFDSLYEQVKEKLFDYNMVLTKLDIYNYLEHQTSNFMKDKVKIVLWEMCSVYNDYCKVVNEEVRREYLEKGWDIPQRTRHNEKLGKDMISTDYMQMRCKLYPLRESSYFYAIKLLRKQFDDEKQIRSIPRELSTPEAKKYFEKAIELGLMDANYNWKKGKQMLACFAREMSIKLKLGKGERISWRPFEILFGIEKGNLRLNYNDIQKTGQDPSESKLIDKVFE